LAAFGGLGAVAATAVALILSQGASLDGQRYTEFYLLGPGDRAGGYPSTLTVGQEASLILGILNQEGKKATYDVALFLNGAPAQRVSGISLGPGQRWERGLPFTVDHPGEGQVLEFVLYKDGGSQPYRTLRLRVDAQPLTTLVQAREEIAFGLEASPALTEGPPPVAVESTYEIHIVSPGENLTFISHDYGVPLEAVIEANAQEIPNPNLIYPDQPIRIPVEAR